MNFRAIGNSIIILLLITCTYQWHTIRSHQKSLEAAIDAKISQVQTNVPTPQSEVVERIIAGNSSWASLQTKVKDAVVQVFSQVAATDLLQPYKTPVHYQTTGSGFFINNEGEIITNAHVVDQAKAVWIQIPSLGKHQIDVDIVGVSPDRDLALLKVREEGKKAIKEAINEIKWLPFGDSHTVYRAEEIMALGYPLGQQGLKSTTGVVSGREQHLIQIDAPINPGNSGGPSLNASGQVIGVNTLYAPDAQNVGYIIPINELKVVLDDLRKTRLLRKPFLGVLFNNASDSLTKYLNNPLPGGLYVVDVYKNSPLHRAGVRKGDMIYEINGQKIDVYGEMKGYEDKMSLIDYVAQLKIGQPINLVVYRNGKRHDMNFIFDQSELLPIRKIYPGYEPIDYEIIAGMLVQPLTLNHLPLLVNNAPSLTKYAEMRYQIDPALIITHIFPDSQAQRCRALIPGAILTEVNGQKVKTLTDLRQALFKSISSSNLTLETGDGVFVVCPFMKVLDEEKKLSKNYFYALSDTVRTLIAQAIPAETTIKIDTNIAQAKTSAMC